MERRMMLRHDEQRRGGMLVQVRRCSTTSPPPVQVMDPDDFIFNPVALSAVNRSARGGFFA